MGVLFCQKPDKSTKTGHKSHLIDVQKCTKKDPAAYVTGSLADWRILINTKVTDEKN